MASVVTNNFKKMLLNGAFPLSATGAVKCALLSVDMYNYTIYSMTSWTELSAAEITGSGYTYGGETLSGVTIDIDTENQCSYFNAADVQWNPATFTTYGAALYKATTLELLGVIDFEVEQAPNAGVYVIEWNTNGILQVF